MSRRSVFVSVSVAAVVSAVAQQPAPRQPASPYPELPRSAVAAGVVKAIENRDKPVDVEAARQALGQWIETQQIISKERKDWQLGEAVLKDRIELVKKEVSDLDKKRESFVSNISEADKKKAELVEENERLKTSGQALQDSVRDLEGRVQTLFKVLPEPMQGKVKSLLDRIPLDPEHSKITLAERFQNILGILNEVNKINSEITLATEVRTLASGKPAEVRTIYVGLAQAYFVTSKGDSAGIGRPTAAGWEWTTDDSIAPKVVAAVMTLQGKNKPAFIPLPLKLQ